MSYILDGSTDWLNVGSDIIGAYPFSISALTYPTSNTTTMTVAGFGHSTTANLYYIFDISGTETNDPYRAIGFEPSHDTGVTRKGESLLTINAWQHSGISTTGGTAFPTLYVDGVSVSTSTAGTGDEDQAFNRTAIGAVYVSGTDTGSNKFTGNIAEVGFWNVILTAGEMRALGKGYSPLFIRPNNLVAYLPLIRDKRDLMGTVWTENGTATWGAHPRVIYPSAQIIQFPPAAAAGRVMSSLAGVGGGLAGEGGIAGKRGGLAG